MGIQTLLHGHSEAELYFSIVIHAPERSLMAHQSHLVTSYSVSCGSFLHLALNSTHVKSNCKILCNWLPLISPVASCNWNKPGVNSSWCIGFIFIKVNFIM
ncbi:hypothetical protein GDO81_018777 [Engystomops pustulosus]|uniref:Uncharacterized protein n=1 Tax=Engystomops pustulosus TaxID=76066 RepID=A0AAV6YLI3_ENGPU|nr:hypothetical protein GDO81_018777 [Engystomops pustulosus]